MNVIQCENGHFFDCDKYLVCPHCGANASKDAVQTKKGIGKSISPFISRGPVSKKLPEVGKQPQMNSTSDVTMTMDVDMATDIQAPIQNPMQQPFINAPELDKTQSAVFLNGKVEPPVGWLVCIKGIMHGDTFTIIAGRNSIGRSDNNSICLKNDNSVSREKHAWLTYDTKHREFLLAAGEGSGLTYVNDEIVMGHIKLKNKDLIEIGNGTYIFVPLCDDKFSWDEYLNEE